MGEGRAQKSKFETILKTLYEFSDDSVLCNSAAMWLGFQNSRPSRAMEGKRFCHFRAFLVEYEGMACAFWDCTPALLSALSPAIELEAFMFEYRSFPACLHQHLA